MPRRPPLARVPSLMVLAAAWCGLAPMAWAQAPAGEAQGIVKWYSASKGYGFVKVEGAAKDVFIPAKGLNGVAPDSLREDVPVVVRVTPGTGGRLDGEIVRLGRVAKAALPAGQARARVKWYNPHKGYGFVRVDSLAKDAFLPAKGLNGVDPDALREDVELVVRVKEAGGRLDAEVVRLSPH